MLTTSIGLPQKAFNIRRNPKVSLLFSDPTGSGIAEPGAVLIQGDATAEDRIVTDVSSDPEFAALAETLIRRQPAGAIWSSPLGRRMWWSYYMRILIYVITTACALLADSGFHSGTAGTRSRRGASCGLRRPSGSTSSTKPY